MIVAFEGLDGAGKTTQATLLKTRLEANGRHVLSLRLYKEDAVEEMLTRLDETTGVDNRSARFAMLAKLIARDEWLIGPENARGTFIIYDKFILTLLASEVIRGATVEEFAVAAEFITPPDVTFAFTVAPEVGLERKGLPGYRESGLDLLEADGTIDVKRFMANDFEPDWLRKCYVDFQNRLTREFRESAEDGYILRNVLGGNAPVWIPPEASIEEVSDLIDETLERVSARAGT